MSVENPNTALTAELQAVRHIVLRVNDLGVQVTRAISAIGHGEISSNSDIAALAMLHEQPRRPGTIADLIDITTAGTTNLLDRLEARQLINRNRDSLTDARGILVEITQRGRRTIEAINNSVAAEYSRTAPLRAEIHRLIGTIVPDTPREAHAETEGPLASLYTFARLGNTLIKALTLESDVEDPTPSRTAITLCAAAQPNGTRPSELLRITTLTSGGISQLLDRLERRQLIERIAGLPPDKRAVTVRLTGEGQHNLQARLSSFRQQVDMTRLAVAIRPTGSKDATS